MIGAVVAMGNATNASFLTLSAAKDAFITQVIPRPARPG
jgi:hypothetical protein